MPKLSGLLGMDADKQTIQLVSDSVSNGIIGGYNTATGEVLTMAVKNVDNAADNGAAELTDELELTVDTDRVFNSGKLTMIRVAEETDATSGVASAVEAFKKAKK